MRIGPHLFHLAEPPLGQAGTARPHPARRWDTASSEEGTPTPAQHRGPSQGHAVTKPSSPRAQAGPSSGRRAEPTCPICLNPTRSLRPSAPCQRCHRNRSPVFPEQSHPGDTEHLLEAPAQVWDASAPAKARQLQELKGTGRGGRAAGRFQRSVTFRSPQWGGKGGKRGCPGYPQGEAVGSREGKEILRTELTCTRSAAPRLEEGEWEGGSVLGVGQPRPLGGGEWAARKATRVDGGGWGGKGAAVGLTGREGAAGIGSNRGRREEGRKGPLGAVGKKRGGKRRLREVKI